MVQAQLLSTLITRAHLRVAELIRMLRELRPDDGGPLSEFTITLFIRTILEPAEAILRHMLLLMAAQLAPQNATGPLPPLRGLRGSEIAQRFPEQEGGGRRAAENFQRWPDAPRAK